MIGTLVAYAHLLKIAWHVPNDAEIEFILQIFQVIVEPTLQLLYGLLDPGGPQIFLVFPPFTEMNYKTYHATPYGAMTSVGKQSYMHVIKKNHEPFLDT